MLHIELLNVLQFLLQALNCHSVYKQTTRYKIITNDISTNIVHNIFEKKKQKSIWFLFPRIKNNYTVP